MKFRKELEELRYLHHLISSRATGKPKQFAHKLNLSVRQLYRILDELKDIGFPIRYSEQRNTYYYEGEVKLNFEMKVDGKSMLAS